MGDGGRGLGFSLPRPAPRRRLAVVIGRPGSSWCDSACLCHAGAANQGPQSPLLAAALVSPPASSSSDGDDAPSQRLPEPVPCRHRGFCGAKPSQRCAVSPRRPPWRPSTCSSARIVLLVRQPDRGHRDHGPRPANHCPRRPRTLAVRRLTVPGNGPRKSSLARRLRPCWSCPSCSDQISIRPALLSAGP